MSISALLSEQPSNVFTSAKLRLSIAFISLTRHDIGLKTSAIVFCDLNLGYGLLFHNFFGNDLIIDFGPVLARAKSMKIDDRGFLVRIEFSTKVFLGSNEF